VPSWRKASETQLAPHKIENTMAFMVETALPWRVAANAQALAAPDYDRVWTGFPKAVLPR
jgi:homogentisate 1,2-dioxygenase